MCGIVGILDKNITKSDLHTPLSCMLDRIVHRGPDDFGVWQDRCVAIGHRRLSILDLSPLGKQPMISASGRYILAFNGEIYNHLALRKELESCGKVFRGHSDTEVLLALIEEIGLIRAVQRCVGMFAVAVFDIRDHTLQLARDRFGEKPLYYGWHGGCFLFGSELKALLAHPAFQREVNHESLSQLIMYGYVSAPHCIFKDTFKLLQGTILTLHVPDDPRGFSPQTCKQEINIFWSAEDVAISGLNNRYEGDFTQATDELESILLEAVGIQMHADVPLGAFLSGGIDSSLVVALMQQQANIPVKTFSIGFDIEKFNEAKHAEAVARHIGTEHTELYVRCREALDVIPLLPEIYDEPLGDPSQIPTYLVAKLARQHVTVSLSGDGGDEIFCGYPKYSLGQKFADLPFRKLLGKLIGVFPFRTIENITSLFNHSIADKLRVSRFITLQTYLRAKDNVSLAEVASRLRHSQTGKVLKEQHFSTFIDSYYQTDLAKQYSSLAMVIDRQKYLPDDILAKVDRVTMAVSLESRAPLLDHRVVEFVSRLPMSFLSDKRSSKKILRHLLFRYVPKPMVDRPKMGFSIPLARWLTEELRDWAWQLFDGLARSEDEFLNLDECRMLLDAHVRGKYDFAAALWPVLMFQAWRRKWL
jgi:asparagine synthase (glutamine-hydrolysing)